MTITINEDFQIARSLDAPVISDTDWVALQAIDGAVEMLDATGFTRVFVKAIATGLGGQGVAGACKLEVVSLAGGVVASVGDFTRSYGTTRAVTLAGATSIAVRLVDPTGAPTKLQIFVKGSP